MQSSNGNMYPGKQTWNPLGGECRHKCTYCYRNSWKKRQKPHNKKYSDEPRLFEKEFKSLGHYRDIFVCSMTDLFAKDVEPQHIVKILQHTKKYYLNTYLFQTKFPANFKPFIKFMPHDFVLGTTIETNRDMPEYSKACRPVDRAKQLAKYEKQRKMVSIEPIMDFDLEQMVHIIKMIQPEYVSIGADSKHHKLPEPDPEKIIHLIDQLREFTNVRVKKNLSRIMGKELPENHYRRYTPDCEHDGGCEVYVWCEHFSKGVTEVPEGVCYLRNITCVHCQLDQCDFSSDVREGFY